MRNILNMVLWVRKTTSGTGFSGLAFLSLINLAKQHRILTKELAHDIPDTAEFLVLNKAPGN